MKIINFLYYTIYRVFKLFPRKGFSDHKEACTFFSVLLSTNIITTLIFSLRFLGIKVDKQYNLIGKLVMLVIFVVGYLICKYYYVNRDNYKKIIAHFEEKKRSQILYPVLGIGYMLATFSGFLLLAMYINKFTG